MILGSEVNDEVANNLVSQLLYLASENPEKILLCMLTALGAPYKLDWRFSTQ